MTDAWVEASAPIQLRNQLEPQISLMTPTELTLSTENIEVYYAGENLGQPFFHLGMKYWLTTVGNLNFYGAGRLGYTFRQGLHRVLFTESGWADSDSVRLHWIPLSASLVTEYASQELPFLRPYFALAAGTHLMHQRSNLENVTGVFILPFISTGFGVSFINLDRGDGDTLVGFSFGMSYQNTLSTHQPIRGWSFDFGFNLSL